MRRSFVLIGLSVAVSGCSTPASRPSRLEGGPTMVTPLMLEPPPVYSILGFRDKLQLTSAQITSLDSIATWAHDQNAPLVDSLRERATPSRNQVGLLIPNEMRPTLDAVRKNNRQAARGAGEVLSATQRTSACEIFEEQRQDREGRDGRNGQPRRSSRLGSEADSILASARRSIWPWCTAATQTAVGR
jgi:hypothetical protein